MFSTDTYDETHRQCRVSQTMPFNWILRETHAFMRQKWNIDIYWMGIETPNIFSHISKSHKGKIISFVRLNWQYSGDSVGAMNKYSCTCTLNSKRKCITIIIYRFWYGDILRKVFFVRLQQKVVVIHESSVRTSDAPSLSLYPFLSFANDKCVKHQCLMRKIDSYSLIIITCIFCFK